MANKRMFSREIVESDSFLDMPVSARCLYFHLGLQADVKGFVAPRKVMRMTGAGDDDLKVLVVKGFVIPFESGVIIITHWNAHNNVRDSREAPSQFVEEFNKLTVSEEGKYSLPEYSWSSTGVLPPRLGEVSVGEVRGGEKRKPKATATALIAPDSYIEGFKEKYPGKDVENELAKAYSWLQASGKTYKNYQQFYNYWLLKADNASKQGGVHVIS